MGKMQMDNLNGTHTRVKLHTLRNFNKTSQLLLVREQSDSQLKIRDPFAPACFDRVCQLSRKLVIGGSSIDYGPAKYNNKGPAYSACACVHARVYA